MKLNKDEMVKKKKWCDVMLIVNSLKLTFEMENCLKHENQNDV